MEIIAVVLGVLGLAYLISCALHPYKPCPQCGGSGRHFSPLFSRRSRLCTRCGGRNRVRRTGSYIMNSGQRDASARWIQGPRD